MAVRRKPGQSQATPASQFNLGSALSGRLAMPPARPCDGPDAGARQPARPGTIWLPQIRRNSGQKSLPAARRSESALPPGPPVGPEDVPGLSEERSWQLSAQVSKGDRRVYLRSILSFVGWTRLQP